MSTYFSVHFLECTIIGPRAHDGLRRYVGEHAIGCDVYLEIKSLQQTCLKTHFSVDTILLIVILLYFNTKLFLQHCKQLSCSTTN